MLETIFHVQHANNQRFKTSFTLVFLAIHPLSDAFEQVSPQDEKKLFQRMTEFLQNQVRNSDIAFHVPAENEWVVLLTHSGEEEASYFLRRIQKQIEDETFTFSSSVVEVGSKLLAFDAVIKAGEQALHEAVQSDPFHIEWVQQFKGQEIEQIKVSIVEEDEITQTILSSLLERSVLKGFQLQIQSFFDGEQFLSSDWYQSGHTHIVIMNDVLPKKNGIELLHALRQMPNHQKYIIFMLSKRKSEEDMFYGLEHGVDEYVTKPFSVKLFEAQVKKVLKRLR